MVFYAAIKGLLLAVSQQVHVWRLRRWRGHCVVCGAGKRGRLVALNLRAEGLPVVVVEKDPANEAIDELRAAGVRLIVGSATNSVCQEQARMETAALVVALTATEESNLEVALAASRRSDGLPVEIMAHASRRFAEEFEEQPPFDRIRQGVHAHFFDLPESLRRANRAQADHQPIKLRTLAVSRTPETVEALADAEHRRWMAEKIMAGWRHGEQRDNARKLHPCLKPYSQLSEVEKQKDRDTVQTVLLRADPASP